MATSDPPRTARPPAVDDPSPLDRGSAPAAVDRPSDPSSLGRPSDPCAVDPSAVDPRGPRFAAWVTTVVLAAVLLTGSGWLLAAQAAVFALGAFAGLRFAPYAALYRVLVAPRLGPPTEREPAAPVRFAQGVGFGFAVLGTVGYLTGLTALGVAATAAALAAAFLNAAFGLCLGCLLYLRGRLVLHSITGRDPELRPPPHEGAPV